MALAGAVTSQQDNRIQETWEGKLGRFLFAMVCAAGLSTCTEVEAGNEMYVSVNSDLGEAAALQKAAAHCGQFGKRARLNNVAKGHVFTYHCVRPDQ